MPNASVIGQFGSSAYTKPYAGHGEPFSRAKCFEKQKSIDLRAEDIQRSAQSRVLYASSVNGSHATIKIILFVSFLVFDKFICPQRHRQWLRLKRKESTQLSHNGD